MVKIPRIIFSYYYSKEFGGEPVQPAGESPQATTPEQEEQESQDSPPAE